MLSEMLGAVLANYCVSYSFIASPNLLYARINLFVFQSMSLYLLIAEDALELVGKRLDAGLLSVVISQEAKRSVKVGFI